jgi:hypothetical protein
MLRASRSTCSCASRTRRSASAGPGAAAAAAVPRSTPRTHASATSGPARTSRIAARSAAVSRRSATRPRLGHADPALRSARVHAYDAWRPLALTREPKTLIAPPHSAHRIRPVIRYTAFAPDLGGRPGLRAASRACTRSHSARSTIASSGSRRRRAQHDSDVPGSCSRRVPGPPRERDRERAPSPEPRPPDSRPATVDLGAILDALRRRWAPPGPGPR